MTRNILFLIALGVLVGCSQKEEKQQATTEAIKVPIAIIVEAESFTGSDAETNLTEKSEVLTLDSKGWLSYSVDVSEAGRYKVQVIAEATSDSARVWLEDYTDNTDGRTYNITGSIDLQSGQGLVSHFVDGSPLNTGIHQMKLHFPEGNVKVDKVIFTLMVRHQQTPETLTQSMEGSDWDLVWSDEFSGEAVDTTNWLYDVGDWGWGNNELQYYTVNDEKNSRVEDGNLVIEARKNTSGEKWTSARLTTRGRKSFLYGKIEFRAQVPREKGNWAAGWTLGDSYVDELSWPYCGEIDILESVGYEVDNESGDGIAHATVHTPAYYFKINNQISSVKDIKNIAGEFHTYGVEWTPTEVRGYVDGEQYYVYDKNANDLEWPFSKPQNIILNLAMGGGWGGAQGMDPDITSQKFLIDYVRVYQLK